ncbi:30S ribosomal protein S20 [bacterium]|nr:30S ribosomal protein S20 [bacterium]
MANTKSAKKQVRKTLKKAKVNRFWKDSIKLNTKKLLDSSKEGTKEKAAENFKRLKSTLDKASKRGVLSKNKSARIKSRMSKSLSKK